MKRIFLFSLIVLLAPAGRISSAGPASSSMSKKSLVESDPFESISIGVNYETSKRGITRDRATLETKSLSAYIGYDVCKWWTVFTTLGSSQSRLSEHDKFGDSNFKWSAGLNASLWQVDVEDPALFNGRISLKPALEFSQYSSKTGDDNIRWYDMTGTLLLGYEKLIEDPKYNILQVYSFSMYVGPAFSRIDGSVGEGLNKNFEGSRNFGVIGGFDVFVTQDISVGAQIQSFDKQSFSGSLRYHF